MRDYHNYDIWERARRHAVAVRRAARAYKGPINSSLRSQTVRSAESIILNFVEGCSASSDKEFARFLNISIGSANELQAQLELALDDDLLSQREWEALTKETVEIRKMIFGLRRKLLCDEESADEHDAH